jgi:hypothetical protein
MLKTFLNRYLKKEVFMSIPPRFDEGIRKYKAYILKKKAFIWPQIVS